MPPVDTKRVPISQAARELGIRRDYIHHWLKTGELDAIRFGRQGVFLVRPTDVRALMTGTSPSAQVVAGNNSLPASSFRAPITDVPSSRSCSDTNVQVRPPV